MSAEGSRTAVIAAFIGNSLIAAAKFVVAIITGSSAMLSEAWHSVADTGNQALLLRGIAQSHRAPDVRHPFGRGKETYFWSFMVAVMLFVGGAVLSIQHGLESLRHDHEVTQLTLNFVVLGFAFVVEGLSFRVALREFNQRRGSRSLWRSMRSTTDTSILVVLLEDSAALVGLILAFLGLVLTRLTGDATWDGIASLFIGLLLGVVAVILATETKALLIGEAASRQERAALRAGILALPEVASVGRLLTMQLGPDDVLVNVEVDMIDGLSDDDVEAVIDRAETAIREVIPGARSIFIELESAARG